jgi:hypothetical protein
MPAHDPDTPRLESPLGGLERSLIDEYIRACGIDPATLADLPADKREALLKEASIYASSRLSEVESRSHYVHEIHQPIGGTPKTGLE